MSKRKTARHFPSSDAFWDHVGPLAVLGRVEVLEGKWHAYWKPRGRVPDFIVAGAFSMPQIATVSITSRVLVGNPLVSAQEVPGTRDILPHAFRYPFAPRANP